MVYIKADTEQILTQFPEPARSSKHFMPLVKSGAARLSPEWLSHPDASTPDIKTHLSVCWPV